jgi:hypothetical protein
MDWTALKLMLEGIEPGRLRKRYRLPKSLKMHPPTLLRIPSLRYDAPMEPAPTSKLPSEADPAGAKVVAT